MLSRIRKKLTHLYAMVFGIFLLAFIGIVCAGIVWGTYMERTDEIKTLANELAREERAEIIKHYQNINAIPQEMPMEADHDISGQVFYYIVDRNGQIIEADLPVPVLRETVLTQIQNWKPSKETKFVSVELPTGSRAALIMAAHKVEQGSNVIATVYAGRDVTAYVHMLIRSILTVTAVAILFLILAAIVGYALAGKVIVPIEQSLVRQKQFVADASHELRNPLSILLTSMEAVEMDTDNVLSAFSREIINDAKEEFLRLKRMVNDLLTLARADTGDIELKKERFLLDDVVQQVLRSFKYACEQKAIAVRVCASGMIEVFADPEKIHQLLYILLDNSIKYSPSNSEVSVYLEEACTGTASFAKIIVKDSGPGIPHEYQRKIFQRFFRVDEVRSRDIEGAGLGLSIAKWIVDAHQGQISVQSEPGQGTQFQILIPNRENK